MSGVVDEYSLENIHTYVCSLKISQIDYIKIAPGGKQYRNDLSVV